jgi:hypothetical protein
MALVASALSAEALRIGDPEVKCCTLFLAGLLEIHTDAMRPRRHGKRDLKVGFVLCSYDLAGEHKVCRRSRCLSSCRKDA